MNKRILSEILEYCHSINLRAITLVNFQFSFDKKCIRVRSDYRSWMTMYRTQDNTISECEYPDMRQNGYNLLISFMIKLCPKLLIAGL